MDAATSTVLRDLERQFRNLSQMWSRRGNRDKADAYRYAASLARDAAKEGES